LIAGALVDPDANVGVDRAGLGAAIKQRLAEVAFLRRLIVLA
jgi:hypothetical protein